MVDLLHKLLILVGNTHSKQWLEQAINLTMENHELYVAMVGDNITFKIHPSIILSYNSFCNESDDNIQSPYVTKESCINVESSIPHMIYYEYQFARKLEHTNFCLQNQSLEHP
jgi:hypothetical protein